MKTFIFHSVPILLRCNPEKGSYNPLCHWQQPQCRPPAAAAASAGTEVGQEELEDKWVEQEEEMAAAARVHIAFGDAGRVFRQRVRGGMYLWLTPMVARFLFISFSVLLSPRPVLLHLSLANSLCVLLDSRTDSLFLAYFTDTFSNGACPGKGERLHLLPCNTWLVAATFWIFILFSKQNVASKVPLKTNSLSGTQGLVIWRVFWDVYVE